MTVPETTPIRATIWEDSAVTCMARYETEDATNLQQADMTSIAWKLFDSADLSAVVTNGSGTLTVADVVFDTLQTDDRWSVDSTGYNFKTSISQTLLNTGGKVYQFWLLFTPSSGAPWYDQFEITTVPTPWD